MPRVKKLPAFTLIELLIVMALIIILAGVAYTTINPALQRRKASQNVMRTNLSKLCLALSACAAESDIALQCSSAVGLAVTIPNGQPSNSVYAINRLGDVVTISATLPPATGGVDNCIYVCSQDFSTGTFSAIAEAGSGSSCAN